ncbi:hypothetical protein [Laspinema palackyanum]|uniref:hypothetical protein n=1 Tax=Laspinema palackyanum TaxID=3231601 RepID=UPI00345DE210|nr:hypothetical protein [Laspinema sp. D2c]
MLITLAETLGRTTLNDEALTLSTGTGSRAASSIGRFLDDDYQLLDPFGVVGGSAALWTDLEPGLYRLNGQLATRDNENDDIAGFWDKRSLRTVRFSQLPLEQRQNSTVWHETEPTSFYINVPYDTLGLTILDADNSRGTSEAIIESIERVADLQFAPVTPTEVAIAPNWSLGDVSYASLSTRPDELRIGTASANRAISTISRELTGDYQALADYGVEGSIAQWSVPNGEYAIEWQFYTAEDDWDRDAAYFWNGDAMELFAERSVATEQVSATRWQSDWFTSTVEVLDGNLTFVTLDTVDGADFSQLRIRSIEQVSELIELPLLEWSFPETSPSTAPTTHDPILGEPPWPYPEYPEVDMGNDWQTAWDLGLQRPWESDIGMNTGTTWTHGYVYPSYHLGASYITENLGGETVGGDWDSVDRRTFFLDEGSYLNAYTDPNAITELVEFHPDGTINAIATVEYGPRLQTWLEPGNYGLSFFTEGDGAEINTALYWSNSDPNYAD